MRDSNMGSLRPRGSPTEPRRTDAATATTATTLTTAPYYHHTGTATSTTPLQRGNRSPTRRSKRASALRFPWTSTSTSSVANGLSPIRLGSQLPSTSSSSSALVFAAGWPTWMCFTTTITTHARESRRRTRHNNSAYAGPVNAASWSPSSLVSSPGSGGRPSDSCWNTSAKSTSRRTPRILLIIMVHILLILWFQFYLGFQYSPFGPSSSLSESSSSSSSYFANSGASWMHLVTPGFTTQNQQSGQYQPNPIAEYHHITDANLWGWMKGRQEEMGIEETQQEDIKRKQEIRLARAVQQKGEMSILFDRMMRHDYSTRIFPRWGNLDTVSQNGITPVPEVGYHKSMALHHAIGNDRLLLELVRSNVTDPVMVANSSNATETNTTSQNANRLPLMPSNSTSLVDNSTAISSPAGIDLDSLLQFVRGMPSRNASTLLWPTLRNNYPELLYVVDSRGIWTAESLRHRMVKKLIRGRVEPTEIIMNMAWHILMDDIKATSSSGATEIKTNVIERKSDKNDLPGTNIVPAKTPSFHFRWESQTAPNISTILNLMQGRSQRFQQEQESLLGETVGIITGNTTNASAVVTWTEDLASNDTDRNIRSRLDQGTKHIHDRRRPSFPFKGRGETLADGLLPQQIRSQERVVIGDEELEALVNRRRLQQEVDFHRKRTRRRRRRRNVRHVHPIKNKPDRKLKNAPQELENATKSKASLHRDLSRPKVFLSSTDVLGVLFSGQLFNATIDTRIQERGSRWSNLRRIISGTSSSMHAAGETSRGGFPFVAWFGDFRTCNRNNWLGLYSIPIFTVCGRVTCDFGFPTPTYKTITDSQRTTADWRRIMHSYAEQYPWQNKTRQLIWRGSLTGQIDDETSNPRWRLCRLVHQLQSSGQDNQNLLNIGLVGVPARHDGVEINLDEVGGLVDPVRPMESFQNYQAILDIDGNSWSSRFGTLLCYNSVILKVDPLYVDYFHYKDLEPWKHFVPVKYDLSDLMEQAAFVTDPVNRHVVLDIIHNANEWCATRMVHASIAADYLDIWQNYVEYLDRGDPNWMQKWQSVQGFVFDHSSHYSMKLLS